MLNKALRILIADSSYAQALSIEKMFNRLGYYCIGYACSVEEAERLSWGNSIAFELLMINSDLLENKDRIASRHALEQTNVKNIIVYYANNSEDNSGEGRSSLSLDTPLYLTSDPPEYSLDLSKNAYCVVVN
ncbi:hypothetical protein [Pseudomonas lactis]|uniref:hypothetical protein n=1 Tax=Pseudomonas lactis TaxID=1615674 RepID=UPI0006ACD4FC|nr:hypothetical protein [Pseudomonas lactis]